jgi:NAD-dependent deacetylase
MYVIEQCASLIQSSKNILILTGAGMSTESGIPDFRSNTGLYAQEFEGLRPETILSISFFNRNPKIFWNYIKTHMNYPDAKPNMGHTIIAKWEKTKSISIVTQNIDQLHTLAGSKNVIEVHGSITTCTCQGCGKKYNLADVISKEDGYICGCGSRIRPDIVLYEESVDKMSMVYPMIEKADLLIVLGTSLTVYPVAVIPELYDRRNKHMIIINKTSTPYDNKTNCIEIHAGIGKTLEEIDSVMVHTCE